VPLPILPHSTFYGPAFNRGLHTPGNRRWKTLLGSAPSRRSCQDYFCSHSSAVIALMVLSYLPFKPLPFSDSPRRISTTNVRPPPTGGRGEMMFFRSPRFIHFFNRLNFSALWQLQHFCQKASLKVWMFYFFASSSRTTVVPPPFSSHWVPDCSSRGDSDRPFPGEANPP